MQVLADNTNFHVALVLGWSALCLAAMALTLFLTRRITYSALLVPGLSALLGMLLIGHLSGTDMTGLLPWFAMVGIGMAFVARAWVNR